MTKEAELSPSWSPREAFEGLAADRVDGNSAAYAPLVADRPVAHLEVAAVPKGFWTVFGYTDVMKSASDAKTFSNLALVNGPRVMPLQSDPPEHTAYRRMLNPALSATKVAQLEPEIRSLAARGIDAMVAKGTTDFADDFAYPFPAQALCKLLGAPESDWEVHHQFLMEMNARSEDGLLITSQGHKGLPQYILPYLQRLVSDCRATPGDNLVSAMIQGDINGQRLDDQAVIGLTLTFMLAGHITSASAISNLVLRIAQDADLQVLLRANPGRIPDAIEECLRLDSPVQVMPRTSLRATEISGQRVEEGDNVLLSYGSANVDPAHWPEPGRFNMDRTDKRHVAFGRGIHQCIGSHVARMEIRVAVEELLSRTRSFSVCGEIVRTTWPRYAVANLPLSVTPADDATTVTA